MFSFEMFSFEMFIEQARGITAQHTVPGRSGLQSHVHTPTTTPACGRSREAVMAVGLGV